MQDSDGWTPLHCAASCNNLPMVKLLVESGACIFAQTLSDLETPIEKCEEDEDGYEGCQLYLHAAHINAGVVNDAKVICDERHLSIALVLLAIRMPLFATKASSRSVYRERPLRGGGGGGGVMREGKCVATVSERPLVVTSLTISCSNKRIQQRWFRKFSYSFCLFDFHREEVFQRMIISYTNHLVF